MSENRKDEYFKLKLRRTKRVKNIVGCIVLVLFIIFLSLYFWRSLILAEIGESTGEEFDRLESLSDDLLYTYAIFLLLTIIAFIIFLGVVKKYYKAKKEFEQSKFGVEDASRRLIISGQEKQQQSQQVIINPPSASNLDNMKNCIHCGNLMKISSVFCDKCGKQQ